MSGERDSNGSLFDGLASQCRNCGSHVTRQFARVMGNNDDEVDGCPSCRSFRELTASDNTSSSSGNRSRDLAGSGDQ